MNVTHYILTPTVTKTNTHLYISKQICFVFFNIIPFVEYPFPMYNIAVEIALSHMNKQAQSL